MLDFFNNLFSLFLDGTKNSDSKNLTGVSTSSHVEFEGEKMVYSSNVVGDVSKEDFDEYVKSIRTSWNLFKAFGEKFTGELRFYLNGDLVYKYAYDSDEEKFVLQVGEQVNEDAPKDLDEKKPADYDLNNSVGLGAEKPSDEKKEYVSPEAEPYKSYAEFLKKTIEEEVKQDDDVVADADDDRFTAEDLLHGLIEGINLNNYDTILSETDDEVLGVIVFASSMLDGFDILSDDAEWLISNEAVLDKFFEECVGTLGFNSADATVESIDDNAKDIKFTLLF